MSEVSAHGLLEMPCLGRPFQLGTLYDCRNDGLIPGVTLWGPETLGTAISKPMQTSDFEVITEDTLSEKMLRLDVSAELKLSVLGGLVKAGGSGKFLYDHTTSKSQARVSLRYNLTSRFEHLDMNHLGKFEYPQVFEDDIATHVVTAVQYGADAFFVFDQHVDSSGDFRQISGNMEAMIKTLPTVNLEVAGGNVDILSKGNEGMEKIQCKFYGDFTLTKNPTTYEDAVRVCKELPSPKTDVPKKVWLYPLSKLDTGVQRMVREISSYLIDDLQKFMESLHELEIRINDLVKNEVCVYFEDIKKCLEKCMRLIGCYKEKTLKSLSTLLPKVRGGGEEEAKLAELLEMNSKSPFSYEQVSSWIKEKEREVAKLAPYLKELKKYEVQFAFQSDEIFALTDDFGGDRILCFDFNIPASVDPCLQRMEAYVHDKVILMSKLQQQISHYTSPELRQQFRRFLNFLKVNCSKNGSRCKYVVTNGHSDSSKLGAISIFEDACPTEFEPPDQPGVPRASNVTHNSLELGWEKPEYGSNCVKLYTVSYRSVDDPPDQWSTQTSSEECLVLTKLTPGSLYHFKVTAESAIGSGPESEVGEKRLPPDQPGKPQITQKTHDSLHLSWTKPQNGASIVNNYNISYCFADEQSKQWITKSSNNDCLELTIICNLTSGTRYCFKVEANSKAGISPPSDVCEFTAQPDQPGKPKACFVTHNSLELTWIAPKNGASIVEKYSIIYRSANDTEDMKTSSDRENCSFNNLTPALLYYFKVTAETSTGSSPASDVCEVRLPPSQPGKPLAADHDVTHNSIQLKWNKPMHGADCVQSYNVQYRRFQFDEWSSQSTTQESILLTDLLPNKSYHFQVQAVCSDGTLSQAGECSDQIQTRLPSPGKPRADSITHNSLHLIWDMPEKAENFVKSYTIFYRSDSDEHEKWTKISHDSASSSYDFHNFTPNTYYFKVRAETTTVCSLPSEISDPIVTILPTLDRPKIINLTHDSVELSWTKPGHVGADDGVKYTVFYQYRNSQWVPNPDTTDRFIKITDLLPGRTYYFKVKVKTAIGSSGESDISEVMLPTDQPGKPWITRRTHNSIQVQWSKPREGAETVKSYTIVYYTDHSDQKYSSTIVPQEYFSLPSLEPNTFYYFKVQAVNDGGISPESELSDPIETLIPPPGKPRAINQTQTSIELEWDSPTVGTASVCSYTILYCSTDNTWNRYGKTPTSLNHYIVTGLFPKTPYRFKVRAETASTLSSQESKVSEPVETLMPPPGKPYASVVAHNSIQLSWDKPVHGAESIRFYTVFYKYYTDDDQDSTWEDVFSKTSANFCINNLLSSKAYVFKVGIEAIGPVSEQSDPIQTLLPPPGKPYATNVGYKKFQINWEKPKYEGIICYSISYCTEDDRSKWDTLVTEDGDNKYDFINASPEKTHYFTVSARTATERSSESTVSEPIETMAIPWGAKLLPICKKIESKTGEHPTYQLPLKYVMEKTYNNSFGNIIAKAIVGENPAMPSKYDTGVTHKVLMVVGATGAGKSTLINGMANYVMGVKWENDFRFKLISEETAHDQTVSQTNCITAYTFQKDRGSPLSYTLTIIDTPGFGDTRGVERDKELVKQIKEFFSVQGDEGIDQLHGIGFVTPSPQARLTPTQKYVFHSILSIFGKDVANNIFLMVTFCDGKKPPVLDAVETAGVPFKNQFFKFNNSALFASNQTDDEFDKIFWKMGRKSFEDFFKHFYNAQTQSLQKSREVLKEREQLEVTIQGLQEHICAGLSEIDAMRSKRNILEEHEADIIANREFTRQVEVVKQHKVDLPTGVYVTNCLKCNVTCHGKCGIPQDSNKFNCWAMDKQGTTDATCRICPQKCPWDQHVNNPYKFELYKEMETMTLEKLRDKYQSAMTNREEIEAVMNKMEMDLNKRGVEVIETIERARQSLERLQEIALRPDPLSEVEYIDILIESEKLEARPGWSNRVTTLHDVREQAVILSTVREQKEAEVSAVKSKGKNLWEKIKFWKK